MNLSQPPFRAALFDLDGTLLDSGYVWRDVDAKFFAGRQVEVDHAEYARAVQGLSFREAAVYTKRRYDLPESVETVLVSMGFCGGSWADIPAHRRIVMPRADDCVSILLHTEERHGFDLKEKGHLYVKCPDPKVASFKGIFERMTESVDESDRRRYHRQWQDSYSHIDVIRTGIYDCDSPEYLAPVREDARFLDAQVGMVPGSNTVLEKLVSGQWDDCFCVIEPGETVTRSALEGPTAQS